MLQTYLLAQSWPNFWSVLYNIITPPYLYSIKVNSVLLNFTICTGNIQNFSEEYVFSNRSKCEQGTTTEQIALHRVYEQFANNTTKKPSLSYPFREIKE